MENPQRRTGNAPNISFAPELSRVCFNANGHEISGQGRGGYNRRVLLALGLLNVVLLIVAVALGVSWAKIKQNSAQDPHSVMAQLIELNYFRGNHSDAMKAEEEAKMALKTAIKKHAQLRVQTEQRRKINEAYQKQMAALRTEKAKLQANVSALEGTCGKCLSGWTLVNSSCYFFSSFDPSAVKMSWSDGRADCIRRGADLVVIENQLEQKFVSDTIENVKTGPNIWENGFWIGLTDFDVEGKWVWINNVTEVEQRYWMAGEPNNGGQGEDCGVVVYSPTNPWMTRYDGRCSTKRLHWICEMASE